MAKRRKSKKSSLKGFITLLILVVGILYAVGEYYFPNKVHPSPDLGTGTDFRSNNNAFCYR